MSSGGEEKKREAWGTRPNTARKPNPAAKKKNWQDAPPQPEYLPRASPALRPAPWRAVKRKRRYQRRWSEQQADSTMLLLGDS
jgi:hypothetical protein